MEGPSRSWIPALSPPVTQSCCSETNERRPPLRLLSRLLSSPLFAGPHNLKVESEIKKLQADGWTVHNGGTVAKEKVVKIDGGHRYGGRIGGKHVRRFNTIVRNK